MSYTEALANIPKTVSYVDIAKAVRNKQMSQSGMTDAGQGADTPPTRQSTGERASDPTFNRYDSAIKATEGKDEFSQGGITYFKDGGNMYMRHDDLPGGVMQVHPDAAAKIEAARLENATHDYDRQQYLRKREEWHNTPDTPNIGFELEHSPRSHDPDNTPEGEERIAGYAQILPNFIPAAASFATGSYGIAGPWLKRQLPRTIPINAAAKQALNSNTYSIPPLLHFQPSIDN